MARQEDDSPEARSLAETTRWLQDVLESERHSSAKPLLPRTGRAFPSSSNEYTCAGPPGTARRLRLHQRQGHCGDCGDPSKRIETMAMLVVGITIMA